MNQLFAEPLEVIGLGLSGFSETLAAAGCTVHHVDWTPPGRGDSEVGAVLARLMSDPRVDVANAKALAAYLDAQPVLIAVRQARDAIVGLAEGRRLLHAGPPIAWADMCGPVQGAIAGAIVF